MAALPPVTYSVRRPIVRRRFEGRGGSRRRPGRGGLELEGGLVKAGWRVSRKDPTDRASLWPYMPPRFPLPRHLYSEEMDIRRRAWDMERKSWECLQLGGYRVLKMPPLRDLPLPWRLSDEEEKRFWRGRDVLMGEDLGLGRPPPGIRPWEAGPRLPWMMVQEPAREGSPLPPLEPGPMDVDGTEQVPGDGSVVGEAEEEDS